MAMLSLIENLLLRSANQIRIADLKPRNLIRLLECVDFMNSGVFALQARMDNHRLQEELVEVSNYWKSEEPMVRVVLGVNST